MNFDMEKLNFDNITNIRTKDYKLREFDEPDELGNIYSELMVNERDFNNQNIEENDEYIFSIQKDSKSDSETKKVELKIQMVHKYKGKKRLQIKNNLCQLEEKIRLRKKLKKIRRKVKILRKKVSDKKKVSLIFKGVLKK